MGSRVLSRIHVPAALLALALVALGSLQAGALVGESRRAPPVRGRIVALPAAADHAPAWAAQRRLRGATSGTPRRASAQVAAGRSRAARPDLSAFRGLGAWVDLYDLSLDPVATVRTMRAGGVGTLFIQTGRYNTRGAIAEAPVVGRWLRAAHAAGMKVVGWYLPGYGRYLRRDVVRTVAIARFRTGGHRFDGLGVDIEWRREVRGASRWNRHVASHARVVRARLGPTYPIAAILPPPLQMRVAPPHWRGFPWRQLARSADVMMPMAYWSARDGCPKRPEHCAFGYTLQNVREIRRLTGNPRIPIHIVGGVADRITAREVSEFVRAAHVAGAFGASLYDFLTTGPRFWRPLKRLARL